MNATRLTEGKKINYTPASTVATGQIVDLGNLLGVAERAIAASAQGALAVEGVFNVLKDGSTGPVFAVGDAVFFDLVNELAVRTGGSGCVYFGTCVYAAGTNEAVVRTRLRPQAMPGWMADLLWEDVDISGGSKVLDGEDNGKVMNVTVGHASNVVTLPATAAGASFLVRCGTTGQRVAVSPNASDKLMGANVAGTDNKDYILAAATSKVGDYILVEYGGADGYFIRALHGVWASE